jgi:hypothetical protein
MCKGDFRSKRYIVQIGQHINKHRSKGLVGKHSEPMQLLPTVNTKENTRNKDNKTKKHSIYGMRI